MNSVTYTAPKNLAIDGGKVCLRDVKQQEDSWRGYKAVRLPSLY
jgi:hypothetical protein